MKPLSKELRNKFERTIENAREIAEEAARIALEQLGVGEASPYSYLSEDERALRRRLRAHGRNLGDVRDSKTETQEIDRLVEEIAYEHWHRMLFARFLAENDLLMYYEDDDIENAVPITLSECDELAQELGLKNGWEMAAKLATKMLPQVFRADSPVFKVVLSPEKQRQLERLISNIEGDVFTASDSLGWAYQFWQSNKKRQVNNSQVKISGKELPIVTQLFTENYMVQFLLDNTLGAWWAKKKIDSIGDSSNLSENEIREKCNLPGVPLKYLRFSKNDNENWEPMTNDFSGWPKKLTDLKILDPSCGSGHFLVSIFLMLVPIRMELESLTPESACDAVIEENLHGLEIDQRCVELAAFSLALSAWKYDGTRGVRKLPEIKLAWCGQSVNIKDNDWIELKDEDKDLNMHLDRMQTIFENASTLGTLINPKHIFETSSFFEKDYERINTLLEKKMLNKRYEESEIQIMVKGFEKAIKLLNAKYHWIVTNPPYLSRAKQDNVLRDYLERYFSNSKSDIATSFVERLLEFCQKGSKISLVLPNNWMYMKSYKEFRRKLLLEHGINYVVNIGEGGFESPAAAGAFVVMIGLEYDSNDEAVCALDVSKESKIELIKKNLVSSKVVTYMKSQFLDNKDSIIKLSDSRDQTLLGEYAESWQGLVTTDSNRYVRNYWELDRINSRWEFFIGSPGATSHYRGRENIILWEEEGGPLHNERKAHNFPPKNALGRNGVILSQVRNFYCSIYTGEIFNDGSVPIIPKSEDLLIPIYCYCQSDEFTKEVRKITQSLRVTNGYFLNIPFDLSYWENIAIKNYPNGLPEPYSDDPTQWIFHGNPNKSESPLQVAVARLLGYRWPAELDTSMELSDVARVLVAQSQSLLSCADKDGIVCIPSVRGEAPASERLLNLLAAAYKDEDINLILSELLVDADHAGKSLESWLRDEFFTQHYKLFGHRPFIWQIWDGLKDGFSVLVNYHKLDKKNLETLIYTYLGDWINKQKSAMIDGIVGAEEKLNAAISLKKKLELILEGQSPFDIFVRWKPLNKQPLGWDPDLNDGVRINIRPFMVVGDVGKKGAGVLRDKPNINWTKDRGKDTENSPWYHLFGGDRINDYHLKLEEKKKTREEMR